MKSLNKKTSQRIDVVWIDDRVGDLCTQAAKRKFIEHGYNVHKCPTTANSYRFINDFGFKNFILDVVFMGKRTGIDFLEGIIQLKPDLKFVIFTNHPKDDERLIAIRKYGAVDYIEKDIPLLTEEFFQKIDKAFSTNGNSNNKKFVEVSPSKIKSQKLLNSILKSNWILLPIVGFLAFIIVWCYMELSAETAGVYALISIVTVGILMRYFNPKRRYMRAFWTIMALLSSINIISFKFVLEKVNLILNKIGLSVEELVIERSDNTYEYSIGLIVLAALALYLDYKTREQ